MSASTTSGLARGTTIRLGPTVRRFSQGRLLFGGSPTRLLRLSPSASKLLSTTSQFTITDQTTAALADSLLRYGLAEISSDHQGAALAELTVVVPVYESPRALRRLLANLTGIRTIVVDDGSPDPLPLSEIANEHGATLLRLDINAGPAAARNHGLRSVTTPYVAFCDADTVVSRHDLQRLMNHFADARVAAVAPRILGLDTPNPNWITRYENTRSSLDLGSISAIVQPHSRVGWVPAACLLARTDALGPGFDETMRVGEDVDLVWRLAHTGRLVRYDANTTIYHEHRRTLRTWLTRKYRYGTSAAPLAQRHSTHVAPAVLSPALALTAAGLLLQRPWALLASTAAFTLQAKQIRQELRRIDAPLSLTAELTARTLANTLSQTSALLLRHWLPATLATAVVSRRARRAIAVAMLVDTITEYRTHKPAGSLAVHLAARRLDDAAYGLGVWHGALRQRALTCLTPCLTSNRICRRPPKNTACADSVDS